MRLAVDAISALYDDFDGDALGSLISAKVKINERIKLLCERGTPPEPRYDWTSKNTGLFKTEWILEHAPSGKTFVVVESHAQGGGWIIVDKTEALWDRPTWNHFPTRELAIQEAERFLDEETTEKET